MTAPAGHVAPSLYYISNPKRKRREKKKQTKTPQNLNNMVKITESYVNDKLLAYIIIHIDDKGVELVY